MWRPSLYEWLYVHIVLRCWPDQKDWPSILISDFVIFSWWTCSLLLHLMGQFCRQESFPDLVIPSVYTLHFTLLWVPCITWGLAQLYYSRKSFTGPAPHDLWVYDLSRIIHCPKSIPEKYSCGNEDGTQIKEEVCHEHLKCISMSLSGKDSLALDQFMVVSLL